MEKYRKDYLDKVMKTHDDEAKKTLLESSVMAYNNLPEWDCAWNRAEISEVIRTISERINLKIVYVIDKWEYLSMWTVCEKDSKVKVITIENRIRLMHAKIWEVQETIHEILNDNG